MTRARTLSKLGSSPAEFSEGAVVAGITTIDASGLNITGVVTATSTIIAGITTIDASGFNITGVVTATSFSGDGSSLSGVGVPGVSTTGHSIFNTINVSGIATFGAQVSIADSIVHTGDTDTALRFPSADTFTVETGGSERLRIDSSGNAKIGPWDETSASGEGFTLRRRGQLLQQLKSDTSEASAYVLNKGSTAKVTFTPDGAATFAGSVKIGGTAAANEMDEYEEGTFTIGFTHSGATVPANSSYDDMYYTKIGRICTVYGHIRVGTVVGSGSGNMKITGLPFTVKSGIISRAGFHVTYLDISEATADSMLALPWQFTEGTTNMEFESSRYGGFQYGTGDEIMISATYIVA